MFFFSIGTLLLFSAAQAPQMLEAKPVWAEGRAKEMNVTLNFRAVIPSPKPEKTTLRLTASTLYRTYINGEFLAHGPARAGHGHYRVDEFDITPYLTKRKNIIAIEVASYNCNSYYLLDQPGFLQAEVVVGDTVLAATGSTDHSFEATVMGERVQKVQRYSFQRPFIEVYRMRAASNDWRTEVNATFPAIPLEVQENKPLIARGINYPEFKTITPKQYIATGDVAVGPAPKQYWRDRALRKVSDKLKGYPQEDLTLVLSDELQHFQYTQMKIQNESWPNTPIVLGEEQYQIVDLGINLSGFTGMTVTCEKPTRLILMLDEMLEDHEGRKYVNWMRLGCTSAVQWELEPGTYHLETFEPYTQRYLALATLEGECVVEDLYLREYVTPDVWDATFTTPDDTLNMIYEAGRQTLAQNAVDIFMDCPSRERAGWLCDSFFTARAAFRMSGNTTIERNFFENYQLPATFEHLPEGIFPMCYPSDHYDGVFIPNWALWFVVELEEYLARSGDQELVDALKPKVMSLFNYFKNFENEDGLLEKLESWVFVEWSEANKFVQDVNYPSNMLYAGALSAAGRIYSDEALLDKSTGLRKTILEQSFDGKYFVDNAMRKDGKLEITKNRSEVCQYFALFFEIATQESHPELWVTLRDKFGPEATVDGVHKANSFIGNMLRFELLSRYGRSQQIIDESKGYLAYMAERTGTLWENVHDRASCNHGFASHIVYTFYRDVLGFQKVDTVNKEIHLRFMPSDLPWCKGTFYTPDGPVTMSWTQTEDNFVYSLSILPDNYRITVENKTGKSLHKI